MKNDRIIALRLPAGMYERLRKTADDQDASISALVRQAIRHLDRPPTRGRAYTP